MDNKNFIELYNTNIDKYVESKGAGKYQARYLSWAYAVKILKENFPESSYRTVLYPDAQGNKILPYLKTETGFYVTTELFLTKQDRIANLSDQYTHPVLDNSNKSHAKPDSFSINTSIQRCLTKLIATVTGLGLSLYAGEDVPKEVEVKKPEIAKLSEDDKMKNYVTKEFKSCNSIESIEKKRDDLLIRAKEKGHDLGAWFYDIYVCELDRIAESIESKELIIPAFTENELMAMDALKASQAVLQKV